MILSRFRDMYKVQTVRDTLSNNQIDSGVAAFIVVFSFITSRSKTNILGENVCIHINYGYKVWVNIMTLIAKIKINNIDNVTTHTCGPFC